MTQPVLSMSEKPEDRHGTGGKGVGRGEVKGHRKKGGTYMEDGMELGWGNNKRQATQDSEGFLSGYKRRTDKSRSYAWFTSMQRIDIRNQWNVDLKRASPQQSAVLISSRFI